jgi:hypothetical protein
VQEQPAAQVAPLQVARQLQQQPPAAAAVLELVVQQQLLLLLLLLPRQRLGSAVLCSLLQLQLPVLIAAAAAATRSVGTRWCYLPVSPLQCWLLQQGELLVLQGLAQQLAAAAAAGQGSLCCSLLLLLMLRGELRCATWMCGGSLSRRCGNELMQSSSRLMTRYV